MQTTPEMHRDPVCGMQVEGAAARERGLTHPHEETDYYFCSRGCLLDFKDDPGRFLDANYVPQGM